MCYDLWCSWQYSEWTLLFSFVIQLPSKNIRLRGYIWLKPILSDIQSKWIISISVSIFNGLLHPYIHIHQHPYRCHHIIIGTNYQSWVTYMLQTIYFNSAIREQNENPCQSALLVRRFQPLPPPGNNSNKLSKAELMLLE